MVAQVERDWQFSDGPPLGKLAPSGGSEPHVVGSVGATYVGRFAPSPTGPLHAGSLVAALASWLDAKAHGGQWLVRIEDIDTARRVLGADRIILQQLAACGLLPDQPPVYQSQRSQLYQAALDQLIGQSLAYPCGCSRADIQAAIRHSADHSASQSVDLRQRNRELIYPGTCRHGLNSKAARSWRFLTASTASNELLAQLNQAQAAPNFIANEVRWNDRRLGPQSQNVGFEVGDFVLKRADGLWAYQLAVVVDDAAQGITHIVRGQDLADNTARQILLQRALGLPQPLHLHTPLVLGANGEKLSKQNGAAPFSVDKPLAALQAAGRVLNMELSQTSVAAWLGAAALAWSAKFKEQKNRDTDAYNQPA